METFFRDCDPVHFIADACCARLCAVVASDSGSDFRPAFTTASK